MAANSQETWWSAALLPSFICALKRLWLSLIFLSCFTFGFGWNYWHGHLFSHHHFAWCVLWSLLPLQSLQSYCIWSNSFPQGACPGPKDCCGFNSPLQWMHFVCMCGHPNYAATLIGSASEASVLPRAARPSDAPPSSTPACLMI